MDHHAGPDPVSEQPWELERLTRCRRNHAEGAPPFPLDLARSRLPYAVAWCPLPGITSFLPVVKEQSVIMTGFGKKKKNSKSRRSRS